MVANNDMSGRCFFTICSKNYLAIARTCIHSARQYHPNSRFVLFLCDEIGEEYDPSTEQFEVVTVAQIGIADFADMVFRYDVTELNTAVKPSCFLHLMDQGCEEIVYLDPDLYITSAFAEVFGAFAGGAEAVVTPHTTLPVEDGEKPDDLSMLQVGTYNLGFLALRTTPATREFCAWWRDRLATQCLVDLERGLFVDQKWCDLLPAFIERTTVLRHPGYNVAYWNLMHREVTRRRGKWLVNRQPLRFFHFSGASFAGDTVFSKHQGRFDIFNIGEAEALYADYRAAVAANGHAETSRLAYRYNSSRDGRPIPRVMRELYRGQIAPEAPIAGADAYDLTFEYGSESDPQWPDVPGLPVNRFMAAVWRQRPDLRAAFDLDGFDGRLGYIHWYRHNATQQMGWDPAFEAAAAERYNPVAGRAWFSLKTAMAEPAAARGPGLIYRLMRIRFIRRTRKILRRWFGLERTAAPAAIPSSPAVEAAPRSSAKAGIFASLKPGALLVGYARSELGMGEHVRMTAEAFRSASAPFGVFNYAKNVLARQEDQRYDELFHHAPDFRANIFHINADQLPAMTQDLGASFLIGRRNVIYPAWELARYPEPWARAIGAMDEVWAPSTFIAGAIGKALDKPVIWMPLAVELAAGYEAVERARFEIPQGRYAFVFTFDFASFSSRKNPDAAVAAYLEAFPKAREDGPLLIIKTISGERHPAELERLRGRIGARDDIAVIDGTVSAAEMHGLINLCDCYVSLHRSEGFGRGIAEAMLMGKPVICTAYSGNMDFCTAENSLLVDFRLTPLSQGDYPFWEDQVWADPDVEQAARLMKSMAEDPEAGRAIGEKARAHIATHHGAAAIGRRYVDRLRQTGCLA